MAEPILNRLARLKNRTHGLQTDIDSARRYSSDLQYPTAAHDLYKAAEMLQRAENLIAGAEQAIRYELKHPVTR